MQNALGLQGEEAVSVLAFLDQASVLANLGVSLRAPTACG